MRLKIREIREKKNISLSKLAIKVGVDKATLSRIERNVEMPSLKLAYYIAEALGVSMYDFIDID